VSFNAFWKKKQFDTPGFMPLNFINLFESNELAISSSWRKAKRSVNWQTGKCACSVLSGLNITVIMVFSEKAWQAC
jgi:hypothetical protein